ncbi:MAG: 4-(cytidine 5'-diphospho)-2-C-methyl-D-erythritol kinase [Sedimentisphaerales bacterium]|jgi:4-diphosphocytidyl-2-C-methyl-D-erythritol kinase
MEQISVHEDALSILAPAKINLSLLVAGKRPDGFHELETLMAKVDWYDQIVIQPGRRAGVELVCEGPRWSPEGADNLVHKAATAFLEGCHLNANLGITLRKNIPAGTGLGSGSSDAAATLVGLNHYLGVGLDEGYLGALAEQLGSDVSFFLNGPLAFCTGKGEKVRKIDENFDFLAVLIIPPITVSTKNVYENYRHNSVLYESLSARIKLHIQQNRIDLVAGLCANMLLESCFDLEKSLAEMRETVESLGIGPCHLSGSGSAMFCIIASGDEREAVHCKRRIERETGCECVVVKNNNW